MAEAARMRFVSSKNPEEKGELVLDSDQTLRIEPSPQMVDRMADLEHEAVERSRRYGVGIGVALIVLGIAVTAGGYLAGRFFGKLREMITQPRPLRQVNIWGDEGGGFHVGIRGKGPQKFEMNWAPGDTDATEVAAFMDAYRRLKDLPNPVDFT
jgi:hypothetical protein